MKCICVEQVRYHNETTAMPIIEVGEIYNIIGIYKIAGKGEFYELAEHEDYMYKTHLFIPVSQLDESTFIRNYNYKQNFK